MTIVRESPAQKGGKTQDGGNAVYVFPNNVQTGSLIVVACSGDDATAFVAGDCTKTAGTCTLGAFTLDKAQTNGSGQKTGHWSAIVTAGGSLTITVARGGGNFSVLGCNAYTGSWDSSRVEATNGANGTTGTTPSSGNATSAAAALFYGCLAVGNSASVTLTEDSNFTSIFEEVNGTAHEVGEIIDRIVSTGTTDDANWTISAAPSQTATSVVVYREAAGAGGTTTTKTMSETMTLADAKVSGAKRFKVPSDTMTLAEAQFFWRRLVEVPSDTLSPIDQVVMIKRLRRVMDEGINLVDSFVKSLSGQPSITTKVMSETLTLLDGIYRVYLRGLDEETLTLDDDPNRTIIMMMLDLGIDLTDARTAQTIRGRLGSDNLILNDSLIQWRRLRRRMDESLTLVDQIIKSINGGSGALLFTKIMSEAIEFNDGALRYVRYRRQADDPTSITDGFVRYLTFVRSGTEAIQFSDGFTRYLRYRRTMDEGVDVIDAFSKILAGAGITYTRIMADTITMIDDTGNRWTFKRNLMTDALQMTDSMVYGAVRMRMLQDAVAFTDTLTKWLRLVRLFGDDIEISDGTVRIRSMVRTFGDTLDITDEQVKRIVLFEPSTTRFRLSVGQNPFAFSTGAAPFTFGVQ